MIDNRYFHVPLENPIVVDIVSDVMCPWCYIGKRRFERALEELGDLPLFVRWRPFQLDATLPKEGKDRAQYLSDKFGGDAQAAEIYSRIAAAGEEEGIPFAFERIEVSPNTIDAHRVIRWAAVEHCQDDVVEQLFQAYFLDGRNIGDHETLVDIADSAGLRGEIVRELLPTDSERESVEQEIASAQEIGVTGVPTFIIDERYAVVGAQSTETILKAIHQAVEDRANAPAEGHGEN